VSFLDELKLQASALQSQQTAQQQNFEANPAASYEHCHGA